jgi:hypothetical protein
MAYDEGLTQRIEEVFGDRPDLVAKKMFGGVGFMLRGNMACGVNKDHLMVRVGPERYEQALSRPHVKEFDITGRPMKGWVMVEPAGFESDEDLSQWVQHGIDFALSLPAK